MRVLFVDDDPAVCDLFATFCGALDINFNVVQGGEAALDVLRDRDEGEYVLCVTDLMMPGMDGYSLAQQIRDEFPATCIFAFTGESSTYALKDLEEVFDKIYHKPSDYSRLIAEAMRTLAVRRYPFLA